jgi:hypothetical protein
MPPENENAEAAAEFSPEQVEDAPVTDEVAGVEPTSPEQDDAAASEVVADPVQSRLDELGLSADQMMKIQSAMGRVGGLRSEMQTPQQPPLPPEWQQAQQRIVSYAQSQNVDPTTIPAEIWQKGSQSENPFEAVDIARDWVDDQDGRNGRLARRKTAAGANPPAAAVPAKSKDPLTIVREWGDDPNSHTLEEAEKAMIDGGLIRR